MSQWQELMSFVYKSALLHGGRSTAAVLSASLVGTVAVIWQLVLLCFRCLGSVVHLMAMVLHWMWAFLCRSLTDAAEKVAVQHLKILRDFWSKQKLWEPRLYCLPIAMVAWLRRQWLTNFPSTL